MEKNYVSHLECSITGKKYEANKIYDVQKVIPSIYLASELSRNKL